MVVEVVHLHVHLYDFALAVSRLLSERQLENRATRDSHLVLGSLYVSHSSRKTPFMPLLNSSYPASTSKVVYVVSVASMKLKTTAGGTILHGASYLRIDIRSMALRLH